MTIHKPVLLNETITLLDLKKGDTVVDATLGGGGHAREILNKISDSGRLIVMDLDSEAIERFSSKYKVESIKQKKGSIFLINDNFKNLGKILADLKIEKVDAILADLGWSSDQLEGRGMSFQRDEELDMRMALRNTRLDSRRPLVDARRAKYTKYEKENANAKKIVNSYSEEELGKVIREYGEEKFWKNITRKIVEYRKNKEIETTGELSEIIKSAVGPKYRFGHIHPATRTFQALRIEVNQELENLKVFLPQALEALKSGGRLAIISFHSLEDRIVKIFFRENARGSILTDEITGQKIIKSAPTAELVAKKPISASPQEIAENPRSRSAKLRVIEKK